MIPPTTRVLRLLPVAAAAVISASVLAAAEDAAPVPVPAAKPLALKVGIHDIYCAETACDCIADITNRRYDGAIAALAAQGIKLEPAYLAEAGDLAKGIEQGRFDAVICKPWTALRLAAEAGTPFERVADLADPDGSTALTGEFLVPKDSPIRDLAGLAGKRIAFGQPDSYEKYHAPLRLLAAKGIKPASAIYLSSCSESLDHLLDGKVDAVVICDYTLTATCAVDFAKPEDFRVIATTPAAPLLSVVVDRRKVSAADTARLRAALLALAGDKAPEDLVGPGFVAAAPWQPEPADPATAPPQPVPAKP